MENAIKETIKSKLLKIQNKYLDLMVGGNIHNHIELSIQDEGDKLTPYPIVKGLPDEVRKEILDAYMMES